MSIQAKAHAASTGPGPDIEFVRRPGLRLSGGSIVRVPSILLLLMLGACTGARVSDVQYGAVQPYRQPTQIVVRAGVTETPTGVSSAEAQGAATQLAQAVASDLCHAGVPAGPSAGMAAPPGAAILDIGLTQFDQGNALARIVIGLGAGRSSLQARARLLVPGTNAADPVVAFDTAADSGRKPGLIVPAGIGFAAGNAVRAAIAGGAGLALNLKGGSSTDVQHTASAITWQVRDYFNDVGWSQWPAMSVPAGSCAAAAARS